MHLVRNSENKRPPGAVAQQPVQSVSYEGVVPALDTDTTSEAADLNLGSRTWNF